MQLSFNEIKQIAELRNIPGYSLLLDAIQARIDDLSNQLTTAKPDEENQILAKWRATREIFTDLKTIPETFGLEILSIQETKQHAEGETIPEIVQTPHIPELNPQLIAHLKEMYDRKVRELKGV